MEIGLIIGPLLVGIGLGSAGAYLYTRWKSKRDEKYALKQIKEKEVESNEERTEKTDNRTIQKGEPLVETTSEPTESKGYSEEQEGDELSVNNGTE